MRRTKNARRGLGIRGQLMFFLCFICLFLLVLFWILSTQLLEPLYTRHIERQLTTQAENVVSQLDDALAEGTTLSSWSFGRLYVNTGFFDKLAMDLYSKGGKVRRIYFPEKLCEETLLWLEEREVSTGFIFTNHHGKQITPRGISSQLKVFAKKYRIAPETVYPHSFRHRFAKNFLAKFNDISLLADLMGHESIETTRVYLTRSSAEQRELIDKIVTW